MPDSKKGVCAIILAAGESRRFGAKNKLLVELDGVALLERVVRCITSSSVKQTLAVTGSDHDLIVSLLSGYPVRCVQNPNWSEGMGSSLAFGAGQVDKELFDGLMVCLGDLPYLDLGMVSQILDRFEESDKSQIVIPQLGERFGHPVIFPTRLYERLCGLSGDQGAKEIILAEDEYLLRLPVDSSNILRDIDHPSDLA